MRTLSTFIGIFFVHGIAAAACPPDGTSRVQLLELRTAKWEVADDARRQALALGMLDCLAAPDPVLRDDIAFTALSSWMRAQKLDAATLGRVRSSQLAALGKPDAAGFSQPFAALVMAEVARTDRIKPWMTEAERAELVQAGTSYLAGLRDYRGFDEHEGWRHGVVHAADLMLQLSLNPVLVKREQQLILAAVAAQLAAAGTQSPAHFFRYGEGERLMSPVFYLARRAELDAGDWNAWFGALAAAPAGATAATQASLAHRHNLKSFLMPLALALGDSKDEAQRARALAPARKALAQLQ
ncbi:MAG: DUF2785 domain-containing protein [Telluria sp.]